MAPLLQGIGGAATSLAGVDFSNLGGGGGFKAGQTQIGAGGGNVGGIGTFGPNYGIAQN